MRFWFLLFNLIVNAKMGESSVSYSHSKRMISDSNLIDTKSLGVETEKVESLVQISRPQIGLCDHLEWTQIVVEHFLSESLLMTFQLKLTTGRL